MLAFYRDPLSLSMNTTIQPGEPHVPEVNWARFELDIDPKAVAIELFDEQVFKTVPSTRSGPITIAFQGQDITRTYEN